MKRFFTILMGMLGMVTTSCAQADSIRSVKADEFEKEIKDRHVQLVDVRTADEYAGGFIAGALNIDVFDGQFMQKADKALDKAKPVYVYCRSGKRSMSAARKLARAGYRVVTLEGGIMGWQAAGKAVVR